MFLQKKGKISDHVHFINDPRVCNYLITAPKPALIDAGYTVSAPLLEQDISSILGSVTNLFYLFLTHSHYDHVGGMAYLKRVHPRLQVAGHPRIQKIFSNPKALDLIRTLNAQSERFFPLPDAYREKVRIDQLKIDHPVEDGESFDLDNHISLQAIYSPGHTRDGIWYYLKPDQVLFGCDGLGVYTHNGSLMAEFTSNFHSLMTSLRRIQNMEIEVLALPHSGVVIGKKSVQTHIRKTLEENQRYHDRIEQGLRKFEGDIQQVVQEMTHEEYEARDIRQPKEAFMLNLEAMVRVVKREKETLLY
ncbi:MAG TPA: MBL fold metallo-hydrolase [Bacteroidetes bacterium]|nr:MBL fold metallo-hydrolase [Bacteroidota bacterium]